MSKKVKKRRRLQNRPQTAQIIIPDAPSPSPHIKHRLKEICIPFVRSHSVAIGIIRSGKPRHHCSGTLYAIAEYHFVLTASHCVEGRLDNDTVYYIWLPGQEPVLMFVDDVAYTNDSNDPYGLDIAAFRLLPESATKPKAAGKCFIDQRYLHDDDGLGVCLFFGYPYSLCEDGLAPQGLCLLGPRDDGNTASWRKKFHVLMESNPMITNLATEEKEIQHLHRLLL